jgi:hypothetical protein
MLMTPKLSYSKKYRKINDHPGKSSAPISDLYFYPGVRYSLDLNLNYQNPPPSQENPPPSQKKFSFFSRKSSSSFSRKSSTRNHK